MSARYGRPGSTSLVSAHVLALLLLSQNWRSEKPSSSGWESSATYIRSSRSTSKRRFAREGPCVAAVPVALDAFALARRARRLSSRSEATICFLGAGWCDPPPPTPPPPRAAEITPTASANISAILLTWCVRAPEHHEFFVCVWCVRAPEHHEFFFFYGYKKKEEVQNKSV